MIEHSSQITSCIGGRYLVGFVRGVTETATVPRQDSVSLPNFWNLLVPRSMRAARSVGQNNNWSLISYSHFCVANQLPIDFFPANTDGST
jgi:hypothetical protein